MTERAARILIRLGFLAVLTGIVFTRSKLVAAHSRLRQCRCELNSLERLIEVLEREGARRVEK